MQYSIVNGQKVVPFLKGKGNCTVCGAETLAKCGEKVMWHWAHKSKLDCDPWWEKETEWHRTWKEKFPESYREIVHQCQTTGEKHRADIKSERGIVLEIQNSPISLEEMRSREAFYKNLLWIVNGEKFQSRFKVALSQGLPHPLSKEFDDIVFAPTHHGAAFWRKSENPQAFTGSGDTMIRVHPSRIIQRQIREHYVGHHSFSWQRPHIAWLEAKCPVYLDMDVNSDILWRIESYKGQFRCVRAISKEQVIKDIMRETFVHDIGNTYSVLTDEKKVQNIF